MGSEILAWLESRCVLFGMMNWIYNWYDPAGEIDPQRLADLIARIFLGGVSGAPFTGHRGYGAKVTKKATPVENPDEYRGEGRAAAIEARAAPPQTYTLAL